MSVKCAAITKAGKRCDRPAVHGRQHCLMHDPESAELRRAASVKGGRAKSNQARAKAAIPDALTATELAGWLSLLFRSVVAGKVEPKQAQAAASIARVLLEAQAAAELDELSAEVERLRAELRRQGRAA